MRCSVATAPPAWSCRCASSCGSTRSRLSQRSKRVSRATSADAPVTSRSSKLCLTCQVRSPTKQGGDSSMSENTGSSAPTRVGDNVQRADDTAKLTGGAMYASDLVFAGMLYAQVKKSPHARAKIIAINTSKAENLPGVHAVLTGKELDFRIGLYVVDKPVLARDEVRHHGEAVAAVAAESLDIASRAVDLIDVEYEVLPPVLSQLEALKKDAPRVHPDLGSYEYVQAVFSPQPGTNIPNL